MAPPTESQAAICRLSVGLTILVKIVHLYCAWECGDSAAKE